MNSARKRSSFRSAPSVFESRAATYATHSWPHRFGDGVVLWVVHARRAAQRGCKDVFGADAPVINGVEEGVCQD